MPALDGCFRYRLDDVPTSVAAATEFPLVILHYGDVKAMLSSKGGSTLLRLAGVSYFRSLRIESNQPNGSDLPQLPLLLIPLTMSPYVFHLIPSDRSIRRPVGHD